MVVEKKGFTLVELSIVLVIIGLLIGGILVAQSMITTSKIQAQVRQLQQFDIATTNFKQKFNQIPGDCSICSPLYPGNNNGVIQDINDATPPVILWQEPYLFFIDLYVMGIIPTKYQVGVGYEIGEGKQFPVAAISRGGILVTGNSFGAIYYTFSYQGGPGANTYAIQLAQGNFSTSEALAIDTKLDDGRPNSGDTQATSATAAASGATIPFTAETDGSTSCVYNALYNTALSATNLCRLVVKAKLY